ncbi:MAG: hypothetical protein EXR54_01420 [Dehalococcoidia bacterium]|nr:hypothetical protein [Dehalococcoidia bacterium]
MVGVLALIVLSLGAVTAVSAQDVPTVSGIIYTCVSNSNGDIRRVDQTTPCKPGQTPMNWNGTGPTGATGPEGPSGTASVTVALATASPGSNTPLSPSE